MYRQSTIIIQNDLDYIDPLISYITDVADMLHLNDKERHRICYAVEEVLQRSIQYDFSDDEPSEIRIDVEHIASGMKVRISDNGIPKNPFAKPPKDMDELVRDVSFESISRNSSDQISAVSDFVVHRLLDRYRYINRGKNGRTVEMVIYASRGKIEAEETPANRITESAATFDSIRFATEEDAVGISRLFYQCYGYSYVNDIVYYPQRLADAIKKNLFICAVALSCEGKIVGHTALMRPFEGAEITEWGMAVSDPGIRGKGVVSRLIELLKMKAQSSHFKGIFSHSVTNHTFTQKICDRHDFSDIALLMGYAGSDLSFKKIHQTLVQRESTIISYKALEIPEEIETYLPSQHEKMIKMLYQGIGVNVNKREVLRKRKKGITRLQDTIIPVINIAEIILQSVGDDVVEVVRQTTKKILLGKVDIIYIVLNMDDHDAMILVDELENMGYIFAGILPCYHHEKTLILQYINNIKFDYSLITAYTAQAKALKSYIEALDTRAMPLSF